MRLFSLSVYIKKSLEYDNIDTKDEEENIGDFVFTQKYRELFRLGSTIQPANLVHGLSYHTVISPSGNWEPGLVCVVVMVYPFDP